MTFAHDIAILGLGEIGSAIAMGFCEKGDSVVAYDPAFSDEAHPTVASLMEHGMVLARRASDAVQGARAVIACVPGSASTDIAREIKEQLSSGALYVDLTSTSPACKMEVEAMVSSKDVVMADVALFNSPKQVGLSMSAMSSGPGAAHCAELLSSIGLTVEVHEGAIGSAASIKMLRSIIMKGLSALLHEALVAAYRSGLHDALLANVSNSFQSAGTFQQLAVHLVTSDLDHFERRISEMTLVRNFLNSQHLDSPMVDATIERMARLHNLPTHHGSVNAANSESLDMSLSALDEACERSRSGRAVELP